MKIFIIFLTILCSIVSLFIGVGDLSLKGLLSNSNSEVAVFFISRLPRLIAVVTAGAGISVCGLVMQQLSRNRFVSPTTAGTMDAASLGIILSLIFFPTGSVYIKTLFSFIFTLAASVFFMMMVQRIRFKNVMIIPLLGIIFGNILDSVTTFLGLQFNVVQNMASWLQGDFSAVMQGRYELIYLSVPLVILSYLYANYFTLAGMGESFAKNLGVNYKQIFILGLVLISVVVSSIILTAGMIPFLGLIIPNMVSLYFGDNIRKTLPLTALAGASFLLICDIISRLIIYPYEIPISIIVGVIGGVTFIFLLLRGDFSER